MKFEIRVYDLTRDEAEAILFATKSMATVVIDGSQMHMQPIISDDDGPTNINAPSADTTGIPWDERIHSKNRGVNADGTWRKKRGVTDAIVAAVEGELKMRGAAGMYMQPQPQMQQQPMMQMPTQQPQPQMQQQPMMQQPAIMDAQSFMQRLTGQMQKRDQNGAPLIEATYLANVCQRMTATIGRQINTITDIMNDPAAIGVAINIMTQDGRWA